VTTCPRCGRLEVEDVVADLGRCGDCHTQTHDTWPAPPPVPDEPDTYSHDEVPVYWGPEAVTEVQVPHPLPDRAPPLLPPRP
jgi:hypothetical protein